jgi:hypothetical protein
MMHDIRTIYYDLLPAFVNAAILSLFLYAKVNNAIYLEQWVNLHVFFQMAWALGPD